MNVTRSIALKSFGMVVAALFTVGVATGPAEAAPARTDSGTTQPADSGWGPTAK